jgi:MFS transporter, DHA2 family, multidrug resistance protein
MSETKAGDQDLSRSAAGDRNPWLVAVVISIATFMQVLDTSIANVALQYIAGSLAAGIDESTWILTSYLVASAVVLPISGWLSGVIGRKRFYMMCVATFTVSSILCALAPNLQMLIFFRVLQGLGGGGMAPSEQSMLADTFPPRLRSQAFALYGVAVIVAPTVGPALGGWLTDTLSWHWIFLINGPVGVMSLILVQFMVTEPEALIRERKARLAEGVKIDWIGFLLVALSLGSLEVVLDKGQRDDWFASDFIVFFSCLSAVTMALFIPWELSRKQPIVDLRLFGYRQFATSCTMMLAVGGLLFSTTQLIPQLLQTGFGYTATLSGLALMPGGFAMLLMMPVAGMLGSRVPPKYMLCAGMVVVAGAMWHSSGLSSQADFSFFAWARSFQTIALPFLFVPITSASYAGLPPGKTDEASSLINVARNLGGSIGISATTALLTRGAQVHQYYLVANLVPSSPEYQQAVKATTASLVQQGMAPALAPSAAIGRIGQMVAQQASILAYEDVFTMLAATALAMAAVALILMRKPAGQTSRSKTGDAPDAAAQLGATPVH